MQPFYVVLMGCFGVSSIAANAQASIQISDAYIETSAFTGTSNVNGSHDTALPLSKTLNAVSGGAYSKNLIDWSLNGEQTILSFNVDHHHTGQGSNARTSVTLAITPNDDEPYELSGYYNVTDLGAGSRVFNEVGFYAPTFPLFYGNQISYNTINEQFVLGERGGDDFNHVVGSLTGNLIAGQPYLFTFSYVIETYPNSNSGTSALGNLTLKFGKVPEPSTLVVCLTTIFAGQLRRSRRLYS